MWKVFYPYFKKSSLAVVFRLDPNPIIEEVEMNVILLGSINNETFQFNDIKWDDLKAALEYLKMVNPHLLLNLQTNIFKGTKIKVSRNIETINFQLIQTLEYGINGLKQVIGNAKKLIDMIKANGFYIDSLVVFGCVSVSLSYFSIYTIKDYFQTSRRCPSDLMEKIAVANGLKAQNNIKIYDKIAYNGVNIDFNMFLDEE